MPVESRDRGVPVAEEVRGFSVELSRRKRTISHHKSLLSLKSETRHRIAMHIRIISEVVSLRAQLAPMAELPERSTIFRDPEIQAELKVELLARQHEVSATKIVLRVC